ncbi:hypothetical protein GQ55_7G203400 [Panicum hallii var. hallii]|uniref:Uncharacterized protein n=1 Tax=Panicum hallii var. hallii TaxID=1504633 RepID=A0A2T7CX54_9POAL|nr:hypothetical protein GQ55_7G203400 [Panicum hallii var. hallii]
MCYLFLVVVAERSIFFGTFSPTPTCLLAKFADHVCWTSHHGDLPPGVSQ